MHAGLRLGGDEEDQAQIPAFAYEAELYRIVPEAVFKSHDLEEQGIIYTLQPHNFTSESVAGCLAISTSSQGGKREMITQFDSDWI